MHRSFLRTDLPPVDGLSQIPCANEPWLVHLITVSLALATMAASSSSLRSTALLNLVASVVLKVAGRIPPVSRSPVYCGAISPRQQHLR